MNKCFIDADVLITAIVGKGEKAKRSRSLLRKIEKGEQSFLTDALVLSEVWYGIERQKGRDFAAKVIKDFLSFGELEVIPVDRNVLFEALRRAEKKRKLVGNDLIHLTIALLEGASGIYSYDKDFDGLEVKRIEP